MDMFSINLSLRHLVLLFIVCEVNTLLISRPERFAPVKTHFKLDTEGCHSKHTVSAAGCAMFCYSYHWCRVYVLGPCEPKYRNPCLCTICQMDPIIANVTAEERTIGTIVTPKRLSEYHCTPRWDLVHPDCTASVKDISTTLGVRPIMALHAVAIATTGTGSERYYGNPVCPPNFTPRGQVYCDNTTGTWQDQDTLACFPLKCTQVRNGLHYYAGYESFTKSGRPCWPWKDDSPLIINYFLNKRYTFDFLDNKIAKNYCRVFLSDPKYNIPWCYIADYNPANDSTRFETCNIPECPAVY